MAWNIFNVLLLLLCSIACWSGPQRFSPDDGGVGKCILGANVFKAMQSAQNSRSPRWAFDSSLRSTSMALKIHLNLNLFSWNAWVKIPIFYCSRCHWTASLRGWGNRKLRTEACGFVSGISILTADAAVARSCIHLVSGHVTARVVLEQSESCLAGWYRRFAESCQAWVTFQYSISIRRMVEAFLFHPTSRNLALVYW